MVEVFPDGFAYQGGQRQAFGFGRVSGLFVEFGRGAGLPYLLHPAARRVGQGPPGEDVVEIAHVEQPGRRHGFADLLDAMVDVPLLDPVPIGSSLAPRFVPFRLLVTLEVFLPFLAHALRGTCSWNVGRRISRCASPRTRPGIQGRRPVSLVPGPDLDDLDRMREDVADQRLCTSACAPTILNES